MEKRITTQDKKIAFFNKFRNNLRGGKLLAKTYEKPLYNKDGFELIQLNDNGAVYRYGLVKIFGEQYPIAITGEDYNSLKAKLISKEPPKFIELNGRIIASSAIQSVMPEVEIDKKADLKDIQAEFQGYQEVKDIKDL
jgi:hypothetical protein|nr:MAG TPA: hypothetical protein [Caudoviricetes sp.]